MKKYILTLLAVSALMTTSCSDDFLDKVPQKDVSFDQLTDVIKKYPEKSMIIFGGIEAGNNRFMIDIFAGNSGRHDDFGYMSYQLGLDFMSNDLIQSKSNWFNIYYNYSGRQETGLATKAQWTYYYKTIYNMNLIFDIMGNSQEQESLELKGRALAIRANSYFNLIRIYANGELGIPYYAKDRGIDNPGRFATSEVYKNIEKDLLESYALLANFSRTNKNQINKDVVAGILSRFYLQTKNYSEAAKYARLARANYPLQTDNSNYKGFSDINNPEWMWGGDIDAVTTTFVASFFSFMDNRDKSGYAGGSGTYTLVDKRLYDKISPTDFRKKWFLGQAEGTMPTYTNVKFYDATGSEHTGDYIFMRAAEMYFNEAEALAMSGNEAEARNILYSLVSTRDPQYKLSINTGASLLEEIQTQKRIELWGEGFAFYDMKRWGLPLERKYDGTDHTPAGTAHNYPAGSSKFIFQIPIAEINNNPIEQNPF